MMKALQNLGRALMLPVAVLPAAAILAGLGNWILGFWEGNVIGSFLLNAGTAILGHLGILFAVGVAIGLSKDKHGAAGLSGLVGFLVVSSLMSTDTVSALKGIDVSAVNDAFLQNENVFIGIISGIVSAMMYNRFSDVRLPDALAFFSGKRLAPIMSAAAMAVVAAILFVLWPIIYSWLVTFGTFISDLGAIGAGLYGFLNRLLIPTGLHHALNSVFWFDTIGINDIGKFLAGEGTQGITGRYQAGFFPIMMFGLPAAALAMYHTAKSTRKKQAASLMLAAAVASFFTGVTEPLEFSFMFLAPALYVVHALLTGLSLFIAALFQWTSGFGFSAGFVDYFLSFTNPIANQPYMLILQGLAFAVIYYFLFRFLIVKFNFKTPGRDEGDAEDDDVAVADAEGAATPPKTGGSKSGKNDFSQMAAEIYAGLGGDENVTSVDNCVSRLRLEVKDMDAVDEQRIKATGVPGVNIVGKHSIQVIVGTQVEFVADEIMKIRNV
ncbi:Protein-N(pi)-phosphohistidine--D-glucose phosphotransferase [Lentibacillus sp. JNUCC-1]|uniref:N-acetylglucosamine-specific PTS transporter subunit IIBC n=1 Tax=Lentibacillus sp. JNUCC-1 TaxID=2654513 RepID=UPI0012E883AE|nr:N-acetylglucosamine-specific PTS transporter subunit IIBC [Lentibacillus sp. JNUCC-1]MUV36396.1 Protein-N(pi)-phosphohistidine--D-glucose phosphotransferase [Lentibacillus sp. JNUCC-1]